MGQSFAPPGRSNGCLVPGAQPGGVWGSGDSGTLDTQTQPAVMGTPLRGSAVSLTDPRGNDINGELGDRRTGAGEPFAMLQT